MKALKVCAYEQRVCEVEHGSFTPPPPPSLPPSPPPPPPPPSLRRTLYLQRLALTFEFGLPALLLVVLIPGVCCYLWTLSLQRMALTFEFVYFFSFVLCLCICFIYCSEVL